MNKLYTEEDLKKVISIYSEEYKTTTDEILSELNLTPIELPSYEEVSDYCKNDLKLGATNWIFIAGAQWVLDKIKGDKK